MPETETHEAAEAEDEFADLKYPGDETPDEAEREEAEQEDAQEADEAEGTEEGAESSDDDSDPQISDLLKEVPEDLKPIIHRYADKRVGQAEASWKNKLEEAAELRKRAEIVERWGELLESNPRQLVQNLMEEAKSMGSWKDEPEQPAAPEDPGPLTADIIDDSEAMRAWNEKNRAYQDWRLEQALAKKDEEWKQRVDPLTKTYEQQQKAAQMRDVLMRAGIEQGELTEVGTLMQEASSDTANAWKLMKELNSLRKAAADGKMKTAARAKEKIAGSEEKAGLPSAGKHRAKPAPTGDWKKDLMAELEHEGVKSPFDD